MADKSSEEAQRPGSAGSQNSRAGKGCVAALALGLAIAFFFSLSPSTGPREASKRTQCKNNLKEIALALHNYHEAYGCFPPAYIADKDGRPMHSWRVLILPYLDEKPLYLKYRFDEPWNGPHN